MQVTLKVPTSSLDGVSLVVTVSETKLAAIPIQARRHMTWSPRTILKVAPRAPSGPAMFKDANDERLKHTKAER